jgi:hypothetical protein
MRCARRDPIAPAPAPRRGDAHDDGERRRQRRRVGELEPPAGDQAPDSSQSPRLVKPTITTSM